MCGKILLKRMNISHLIYFVLQYFIRGFVCCQRIICKINKVLCINYEKYECKIWIVVRLYECPEWSFWGGNILKGEDRKYHLFVCGWPEMASKGHMGMSSTDIMWLII